MIYKIIKKFMQAIVLLLYRKHLNFKFVKNPPYDRQPAT